MDTEIKCGQKWRSFWVGPFAGQSVSRFSLKFSILMLFRILAWSGGANTLRILEFENLYSPQRRREGKEKLLNQFLPFKILAYFAPLRLKTSLNLFKIIDCGYSFFKVIQLSQQRPQSSNFGHLNFGFGAWDL